MPKIKSLQRHLHQFLLLLLMLAYVVIPHEGDFRDSLSLVSGWQSEPHLQGLSALQALLQGVEILPADSAQASLAATCTLIHPELFQTSALSLFQAQMQSVPWPFWLPQRPQPTTAVALLQAQRPPPLLPTHLATTLLLI